MPLTAGGTLTIVASSDLGALGAKDGSPTTCNWVVPGFAPQLLPWLAILGLLALKPNRNAAAWLIWLPLGCVFVFTQSSLPILLPAGTNFFLDVITALAVGLAAVWLLSNYLGWQNRFVTFLCVLLALAGFSALAAVSRQGWSGMDIEGLQVGIMLAVGALASAIALSLGGWICRKLWRPAGLCLWLFLSLLVVWLLIAAPLFVVAEISDRGRIPLSEFFTPVLIVAAGNFMLLLPFLVLSSASPFFRERLKALLRVQSEAPPILSAPMPGTNVKI
ncbi:MAG: hypothetical protein ABSA45_01805 [Verrucomicrobiota bacterium]